MVDMALSDQIAAPAQALARTKALDRLRLGDTVFRHLTRAAAIGVLILLSGVIISLIDGSLPAIKTFGFELPLEPALEPGHRQFRRAAGDLRHRRHLVHRHADRGADRPDDRVLPHRTVSAMAAPADRHRHRTARRHSQHHLRHLGPVRLRAIPAGDAAAVPDQHARQCSLALDRCSPARPTASAC